MRQNCLTDKIIISSWLKLNIISLFLPLLLFLLLLFLLLLLFPSSFALLLLFLIFFLPSLLVFKRAIKHVLQLPSWIRGPDHLILISVLMREFKIFFFSTSILLRKFTWFNLLDSKSTSMHYRIMFMHLTGYEEIKLICSLHNMASLKILVQ